MWTGRYRYGDGPHQLNRPEIPGKSLSNRQYEGMASSIPPEWNTQWTAFESAPGEYTVSAGLDRSFDLRGLDPATGETLVRWSSGQSIAPTETDERLLASRLADLGAIQQTAASELALLGDESLCGELGPALRSAGFGVGGAQPDLAVLVRSADGWPQTDLPHLAVDARFHHTLVIGPYVMPGLTTCTDCVDRRIARRWPQLAEPATPAGLSRPALIAELLTIQLNLIRAGTSSLANGLISWDLEAGECAHTTALMFPGCATCDPCPTSGSIQLP